MPMTTENISTKPDDQDKSRLVQSMLSLHGWSAIILGLLLYAVVVTGTIAVFSEEIGHWSNPLEDSVEQYFGPGLHDALSKKVSELPETYHEEVLVFHGTGGRMGAFFHGHVDDEITGEHFEEGALVYYDPSSWEELEQYQGRSPDVFNESQFGALANFFINLHVRLYLPYPWGLLLTGALGLMMMIAAITGLIVHRKLIKELFVQRVSRRNLLLTARDRHVLAGSWNLIFAFILAFTGSFFSFAGSFGLPVMAMVSFEGDQDRMFDEVVGTPKPFDSSPAAVKNIDDLVQDALARSGAKDLEFLTVSRWWQKDAVAFLLTEPPEGKIQSENYLYHAADNEFLMVKPEIGLQPSLGNDLVSLITPLHFGHFAGVLSKAIWFGLGFSSAYVTLTGLLLWTRRRKKERLWSRFERVVLWVGYGLLLSMSLSAVGYFIAVLLTLTPSTVVKLSFVITAIFTALLTVFISSKLKLRVLMSSLLALSFILLVALRWCTGFSWLHALEVEAYSVIGVDVILLLCAAALIIFIWKLPTQSLMSDEDEAPVAKQNPSKETGSETFIDQNSVNRL